MLSKMRIVTTGVLAAAVLVACGPLNQNSAAKGFLGVVQQRAAALSGNAPAAAAPAPVLTRAQADANPGAFLLVTAYGGKSVAAMVPAQINGIRQTWISADGVTVTLENGLIAATRGFPRDLMAANLGQSRQAIAAGAGTTTRIHETLDDLDQVSTELLQCSIASKGAENVVILGKSTPARRVDESCSSENIVFTNTYWVAGSGNIIKSRQAVSPGTGFLVLERP